MSPATGLIIRESCRAVGVYGTLSLAAVISLFPIMWAVATSFKTTRNVSRFPPQWIPDPATLKHYGEVAAPMAGYIVNSLMVAGLTIVVTLVIAAHGGYAAARFNFPLKRFILFFVLSTMMIPGIAVLIPLYIVAANLNLFNTYTVLVIIYSAWQVPMALWLLRGFFESVPAEVEEAGLMDGCSRLGTFYRITLPLVTPGVAAVAIVVFIFVWNEFILALSMTTSADLRLVTVGVYYYITAYGIEWGKLMAAVSLGLLPILAVFLLLQRGFIHGLTSGAIKG